MAEHAALDKALQMAAGLSRGETHVACQHELVYGRSNTPLDLRDGDEAACAQVAKQQSDGSFSTQLRGFLPVLRDLCQVDVRDEVVGVGAPEHQHLECLVCLGSLDKGDEITDQLGPEKVHRRGGNLGEENSPVETHGERLERPGIQCRWSAHDSTLPSLARNALTSAATFVGYWKRKPWAASA